MLEHKTKIISWIITFVSLAVIVATALKHKNWSKVNAGPNNWLPD